MNFKKEYEKIMKKYKRVRLSKKDEAGIVKLHNNGLSAKAIGDKIGVSEWTIRRRLRKITGGNLERKRKFTEKVIKQMADMHKSGIHVKEIAKQYGSNFNYISTLLKNANIKGYNYYDYSDSESSGRRKDSMLNLKIDNRYTFYKTQTALGVPFSEIQEKIDKIEEKYK